jgi:hypothetical protein
VRRCPPPAPPEGQHAAFTCVTRVNTSPHPPWSLRCAVRVEFACAWAAKRVKRVAVRIALSCLGAGAALRSPHPSPRGARIPVTCHVTFFSPADSDRSLSLSHDPAHLHLGPFRSVYSSCTARVRSVSKSTGAGACESTTLAAGDCKRELLRRAAPRSQRWHSGIARQGQSRMRVGQVASAMRVRAGVAPRVASGDRAASKGKYAGEASFTSVTVAIKQQSTRHW